MTLNRSSGSHLKPIETQYKGYRFRSRLEARWAVFFDALGIPWKYEPEGFALPPIPERDDDEFYFSISNNEPEDIWYLPDFYLPLQGTFLEIKPAIYTDGGEIDWPDFEQAVRMEYHFGFRTVILCGTPGKIDDPYDDFMPYVGFVPGDYPYIWCECPICGAVGIQFDGRSARNRHKEKCTVTGDKEYNWKSARLLDAYTAARSARFEHGESP